MATSICAALLMEVGQIVQGDALLSKLKRNVKSWKNVTHHKPWRTECILVTTHHFSHQFHSVMALQKALEPYKTVVIWYCSSKSHEVLQFKVGFYGFVGESRKTWHVSMRLDNQCPGKRKRSLQRTRNSWIFSRLRGEVMSIQSVTTTPLKLLFSFFQTKGPFVFAQITRTYLQRNKTKFEWNSWNSSLEYYHITYMYIGKIKHSS